MRRKIDIGQGIEDMKGDMIGGIKGLMGDEIIWEEDRRTYGRENRRFGDGFEDRYGRDEYEERDYGYRREPDRRDYSRREDIDGDLGSIKMKIPHFQGRMIRRYIWIGKERSS